MRYRFELEVRDDIEGLDKAYVRAKAEAVEGTFQKSGGWIRPMPEPENFDDMIREIVDELFPRKSIEDTEEPAKRTRGKKNVKTDS